MPATIETGSVGELTFAAAFKRADRALSRLGNILVQSEGQEDRKEHWEELRREAVPNAAKKLDQIYPGWHNWVNPKTLDMCSLEHCVLGQISEHRYGGERNWGVMLVEVVGAGLENRSGLFANNEVREAWINEIVARRFAWTKEFEKGIFA